MTKAQCDKRRRTLVRRAVAGFGSPEELEALNALDRAMDALNPFAEAAPDYDELPEDMEDTPVPAYNGAAVGDLRRAASLLREWEGK